MKQQDKQQWITRIINSARDLPSAAPRQELFRGIEQQIMHRVPTGRVISLRMVSAAAAALVVLLAFNYFTVSHHNTHSDTPAAQELVQYYQLSEEDAWSGY